MSKKLVFGYGYDIGANRVITGLVDAAEKTGVEIKMFDAQRELTPDDISSITEGAGLIVGLSALRTPEADVVLKLRANVPVIAIEDVPWGCLRPGAIKIAPMVNLLIIAHPAVKPDAKKFGYKNIRYLGLPSHVARGYLEMDPERSVRDQLRKRYNDQEMDLHPDDRIVYVPGLHNFADEMYAALYSAQNAGKNLFGNHLVLGYGAHPAVKNNLTEEDQARLQDILDSVPMLVYDSFSNAQRVAASDITVFYGGGMTESIGAAYRALPAIHVQNDFTVRMLTTAGIPDARWYVEQLNGAYRIDSFTMLDTAMKFLFNGGGMMTLQKNQRKNFPPPSEHDLNAAENTARAISSLIA